VDTLQAIDSVMPGTAGCGSDRGFVLGGGHAVQLHGMAACRAGRRRSRPMLWRRSADTSSVSRSPVAHPISSRWWSADVAGLAPVAAWVVAAWWRAVRRSRWGRRRDPGSRHGGVLRRWPAPPSTWFPSRRAL